VLYSARESSLVFNRNLIYIFKGLSDPKDSILYYFCIGNVMVLKVYYSIMGGIAKILLFFLRQQAPVDYLIRTY